MVMNHRLYIALLLVGAAGCTFHFGSMADPTESAPPLPDPGSGVDPSVEHAQKARQEEVERYIAEVVYQGGTVVYSALLPSGDIVDFVDRNTIAGAALCFAPASFWPRGIGFARWGCLWAE